MGAMLCLNVKAQFGANRTIDGHDAYTQSCVLVQRSWQCSEAIGLLAACGGACSMW
jgi:hypothetical protein